MVAIQKSENNFIFEVKGLHKLWAFKSQITIPAESIVSVHQNYDALDSWQGLRMPGTYLPLIITAGTYYKGDKKTFWDVVNKESCIIIELNDSNYNQLVIEVENPDEAIKMLSH
jgi:GH35 family endo-1,4-beta-xylanase